MRQWRVGSFSMGLVLVLLGVGLLLDHFSGVTSTLEIIVKWWPAVLILLGLEIIAAGALYRNEQLKIKYDFLSMFIVFVFFLFTLGGYTLAESGLLPAIRDGLTAYEHTLSLPAAKIPLNGIEKVVLSYVDGELELHSTTGDHVEIFGQACLHAPTESTFTAAADFGAIETHRSGSTLYIQVAQLPVQRGLFHYGARQIKRTVLVPAGISLNIEGSGAHQNMQVRLDRLEAPWSINCGGSVQALLSPELDATLYSTTNHFHSESLKGNAPWEIAEPPAEGELEPVSGTFQIGAGTWPLHIAAEWEVTADLWP